MKGENLMKALRIFTIVFIALTIICMAVIWVSRSNGMTPSPLPVFGAIFLPIMAIVTRGAEIEEKEYEARQKS